MNKKNIFTCSISAVAVLLAISGCHVPTITADYTMPPRAVTDIKGIDTMEIVVNVSIPENKSAGDESIARSVISERLAAKFAAEGFFRTTDFVWGNPDGATQMYSLLQAKDSKHGYSRITTNPVTPRARMELNFQAKVFSGQKNLNVKTDLKTVFYMTKYRTQEITWGSGERMNREKIRVPYSVPYNTVRSAAFSNIPQYWISAVGNLDVKVTDKNGKVVYQKKFNNLRADAECDHASLKALPSKISLFSAMSNAAVSNIAKDLSPYKESKSVKINKDGDERGFHLLNSLAFSEAAAVFENIKEKERTFADWENLGITYEVLGDYENAKMCFETALKVKKEDKGLFDYDKNIAEDGIARIKNVIKAQTKLENIK